MRVVISTAVLMSALGADAQALDSAETMARYLAVQRTIPYPQAAEDAGVEGTVLLEFTIDRQCTITTKRVIRGLGYGLDEAALKILDRKFEDDLTRALMPCSPDTLILPINFSLR